MKHSIPQLHETFDKNGIKRYEETILFISENDPRINASIKNEYGQHFIRVGKNAKFNENGEAEWLLMYDDNEKVIQNESFSKYKN